MSSDAHLREVERALDLDPENPVIIERFISSIRRSGGFGKMFEGDEDRERASRRLSKISGDRSIQIEVALRSFGIPFKKARLVDGRSEWQFKLRSFNLVPGQPDHVMIDCAARVSDDGLDLAVHGDATDCFFTGVSTRRLVDFFANPKTVPPVVGSDPRGVFRLWRLSENYRFHFGLSMLLDGRNDRHTGHDEELVHLSPEAIAAEAQGEDEGARQASYRSFMVVRSGLDFQCDLRHSSCYGAFPRDRDESLDPRVVNCICLTALRGERPFGSGSSRPGVLRCLDTQEDQFWTAADLVEATDAFAGVWANGEERSSPESFMKDLEILGVTSDPDDVYSWFARDKYDGHRFACGYTAPTDRARLELEFVDSTSGTVQAKLWSERPDSEPVYAVMRSPRELFERLRGIFQTPGGVV